ncbi:hypothetical protein ACMGDM_03390 [Sphingomonas sp. DT-51]|uniref:hypothetical protein n=1 Tax=Sphingomonas sp. DT-51 TaxID=3396165 RepID=UPI003F1C9AB1
MQRVEAPPRRVRIRPGAWAMLARCLTALLGGYAATAALVSLAARLLPLASVEATTWAMIASFLVYAMFGLWCFHEPRLARVVALTWGVALIAGGLTWLIGPRP